MVCGDCGWATSPDDFEEDAHSQAYLHAEATGHPYYVPAEFAVSDPA